MDIDVTHEDIVQVRMAAMPEQPWIGGPEAPSHLIADDRASVAAWPEPLTSLVGRERAVDHILALLDRPETRLLTLTGPGGVGKTRLAMEVTRRVGNDFADGVRFVTLAPIRDPNLIASAIAKALGTPERVDRPVLDRLMAALSDRHLLLVLDNFEHLLDVSPVWLTQLLGACPRLKALVTSHTALTIGGEQRFVVPPIPAPDAESPSDVSAASAVMLFVQRAHAIDSGFSLNASNLDTVAEICQRLDGLPLAIELAAARIGVLPPEQILVHLTDRFRLLAGGQRDGPARLRSMRDAIDWSYNLLSPDEQRFFRNLSVFIGGFTLEAAEAVCGTPDHPGMDALAGVSSLVDHSLVHRGDAETGSPRFAMLETIREYAAERLAGTDEESPLRSRHADWYLSLVSQHADVLAVTREPYIETINQMDAEYANLRIALAWLDSAGRHEDLARLLVGLGWYWQTTVREAEGLPWYTRAMTHLDSATPLYLDILLLAATLAYRLGGTQASPLLSEALASANSRGDQRRKAFALAFLGISSSERGEYAEAEATLREARSLFALVSEPEWTWWMEYQLGIAALGKGKLEQAARILRTVRSEADHRGIEYMRSSCDEYLFLVAFERDDIDVALELTPTLDSRIARAELLYHHPVTLSTRAMLATARGRPVVAARLFGAASRSAIHAMQPERAIFERIEASIRRDLGEDVWKREWDRGRRARTAELADEIDRLLVGGPEVGTSSPLTAPRLAGLTEREVEVLRLLSDGLTNAQIADRIFVSQRTAATHVRHIFDKLDVSSRAAAVAWAIRAGLA